MTASFIYFDLGNVLVHFDPMIACRQVATLLDSDPTTIKVAMYDSGLEDQLEAGEIDEPEFLDRLFDAVGRSASPEKLLHAMSAMFWLNTAMLPVVAKLVQNGHPMGILSNTCGPHWSWIMNQNFGLIRAIGPLAALSYEIGCMKPDARIYAAATAIADVPASEILFIDDRTENVQGATSSGWSALHYSGPSRLVQDLRSIGCRCFI